jgi:hypothetical protein
LELDDYNGNGYYDIKDFVEAPEKEILKFNDNMKFDVILSNAPYDNGLHEKFEAKYFNLCDGQIVWVSPTSWLLGNKQNKNITQYIDLYGGFIELINGNDFFDAGLQTNLLGITYVNLQKNEGIVFNNKVYNSCSDISLYSNDDFLNIFKKEFDILFNIDSLRNHIKTVPGSSHIKTKYEYKPNNNWWCMRIQRMRGDNRINGGKDFQTFFANNIDAENKMKGQYKDLIKVKINTNAGSKKITKNYLEYYFPFNTEQELNNFINYLKTDFVRTGLLLYKHNMDLVDVTIKYIPWFDFADEHFSKSPSEIDDYLFEKYIPEVDEETGITRDEIRKHIEELLPDYYGIRKG